ncbi:hypothetical protein COL26b_005823 [Colletotrichum chrysophilum]|nr:uncharacterized protein COL26b_005823 [Colletotrichum chrysophilum]KAJ0376027.1 hypothetical protein COL26b_005823 [Colletotrichum chrysophilum]
MALFEEIIRINHVRDGVSNGFMSKDTARSIADNIVKNIEAFDARTGSLLPVSPEEYLSLAVVKSLESS